MPTGRMEGITRSQGNRLVQKRGISIGLGRGELCDIGDWEMRGSFIQAFLEPAMAPVWASATLLANLTST